MAPLELWQAFQPYIATHPWLAPVLAAVCVLMFAARAVSALWGQWQSERRFDHTQQIDLLQALRDQRDAAMRDLADERRAHADTRHRAERAENALRAIQSKEPS